MASAEKRSSGTFRATWRDSAGTLQHQGGFITRSAALIHGEQQEALRASGLNPRDAKMTWGEWQPIWWARRQKLIEASTVAADVGRLHKHVTPVWASKQLGAIRKSTVQAWVDDMQDRDLTAGSILKIYHLFSGSMRVAYEREIIASTPCKGIELPKPPPSGGLAFTMEEIEQILYELVEPYRTAVLLMVYCGLRFGEMAGLHWDKVDLINRRIDVERTWSPVTGLMKAYPKDRNFRSTRIPERVMDVLHRPAGWTDGCGRPHSDGKPCPASLVVPGVLGAPLNSHNMRAMHWMPALRRLGLQGRQHDTRHTFCTWLADAGVPMDDIALLVGHSSTTITKRYSHRSPNYGDKALQVLDGPGYRGPVPVPVPSGPLSLVPMG